MKRGDIYMVTLDPAMGHEQRGHRPVVIVSPSDFNQVTRLPVVLPITNGGDFARRIAYAVAVSGCSITGIVRCDQPRVLDLASRSGKHVDQLPEPILAEVLAITATLFE